MGKYCDDMIKSMEWALRTIYIRSISFQNMTSQNLIDTILKTLLDSKNLLKKSQLNVNKVVECFSECKSYLNNSSKARKVSIKK